MSDFFIKQNDTMPTLEAQLLGADGVPINLSGCTVRFHMMLTAGQSIKVDAAADIVSAAEGKVRYDWQPKDTDGEGNYKAEFEITFPDDAIQTVPNDGYFVITIKSEIA